MHQYDTASGLEGVGNFYYFNKIAKKFPECVRAVYTTKKYSIIIMSGIVGGDEDGEDITPIFPWLSNSTFPT